MGYSGLGLKVMGIRFSDMVRAWVLGDKRLVLGG